jgi:long-chain acyl-CoA synthetase
MTDEILPYHEKDLVDMFFQRVEKYHHDTALSYKKDGLWIDITWNEFGEYVDRVSRGLAMLGIKPGQAVCILSANRPEWVFTDAGVIGAGGITVGIYASNIPEEVAYVAGHCDSVAIFAENEEQLKKVMEVKNDLPHLRHIIIYDMPEKIPDGVISFNNLLETGTGAGDNIINDINSRRRAIRPEDIATYVYTSGTTGPPKGAMITHANLLFNGSLGIKLLGVKPRHETLSFLPLAHLLERFVFWAVVYAGGHINFAENMNAIAANMLERRPHIIIGVPRVYEKIYDRITSSVNEGSPLRRALFRWGVAVGREYGEKKRRNKKISAALRLKHALAERLIYSKMRQRVGGRIYYLGCGGAPLAGEIAEFFTALGMPVIEAYGLTETTAPSTINTFDDLKPGTVGKPLPGVQVKVADDGEILIKGPNVFKGYLKNPEATAEAIRDGWFYSGDIGRFDEEGFLVITDRKKDLIITAGGKNVAPQNIENLFKMSPYISQMMVFGDRKNYLTALLTLNQDEIEKYGNRQGIAGLNYPDLIKHSAVQNLVRDIVAEKNAHLARYEQIKKYIILDADFTQAEGELTPTMKLKRKTVTAKYRDMLEALYREDAHTAEE